MTTLPGMPIALGDPGVFVCGPEDIAPWETEPVRKPDDAGVDFEQVRAQRRARVSGTGWIVANTCRSCSAVTGRYCSKHEVGKGRK